MSRYRQGAGALAQKVINTDNLPTNTKDLPIGKPGPHWKSGHRLSLKLTKPREARQALKENQVRYDARQTLRAKLSEIFKEGQQHDKFPFPSHKEAAKIPVDYRKLAKTQHITPQNVDIDEKDLYHITPELLPMLSGKIRDMRVSGHSWEHITLAMLFQYTAHLKGTFSSDTLLYRIATYVSKATRPLN